MNYLTSGMRLRMYEITIENANTAGLTTGTVIRGLIACRLKLQMFTIRVRLTYGVGCVEPV